MDELQPLNMTVPAWWNLWQRWLQGQNYTSFYVTSRTGIIPGGRVPPGHVASLLMDECQKAYEQGWNDRGRASAVTVQLDPRLIPGRSRLACGYDDGSRACALLDGHEGDHALP